MDQALSLCIPVSIISRKRAITSENNDMAYTQILKDFKTKVTVIGAGGGSLPLGLVEKHPGKLDVEVIDISNDVIQTALYVFGGKEVSERESISYQ